MIDPKAWNHIMGLATHVALESSGYAGSVITRLNQLASALTTNVHRVC